LTYDVSRPLSNQNLELWIELVSKKNQSSNKVDFLDLGCGTGRFSIPIANKLSYSVIGGDISKDMLSKAREKDGTSQVNWILQDATSLPYNNESLNAVFMSHLLHHVDDPLKVTKECYRVLKPYGVVLNRYGAIEQIRDNREHVFFPGTLEIDEARIPSIEQVEEWFTLAGFNEVSSETITQQTYKSSNEILEKASLKSTSVLTLISQFSFQQGLNALREYISRNPNDPWLFKDRITLTTGKKSSPVTQ
jgi:SAM-dependent methyltransferase